MDGAKTMGFINEPLGAVLEFIASLTGGSFAAAVFIFTLLINVALIPLSIKSQKSSVQQTRIKPKLDELKKQYGDDKQRYSQEMQKLYKEENVSMSGGCLPMILRMVLLISIYSLITSPLTYMTGVEESKISNVSTTITSAMNDLKEKDEKKYDAVVKETNWGSGNNELAIVGIVGNEKRLNAINGVLSDKQYAKIEKDLVYIDKAVKEADIDYTLFSDKLDLTKTPDFSFDIFGKFEWIWLMPIMAFAAQMLTSVLSLKSQKKLNPDAPSMSGMMLTMPLISLFIGFSVPGGVAFYWACSSIISGAIQIGVQNFYGPNKLLARERAKDIMKQYSFEVGQIKKLGAAEADSQGNN